MEFQFQRLLSHFLKVSDRKKEREAFFVTKKEAIGTETDFPFFFSQELLVILSQGTEAIHFQPKIRIMIALLVVVLFPSKEPGGIVIATPQI